MHNTDDLDALRLHQHRNIKIEHIGREGEPVMIIDNVLEEPEALVDYAATQGRFDSNTGLYPGIRTPAPAAYARALYRLLHSEVGRIFNLKPGAIERAECSFSIVSTPPEQLHPAQRIPHFDSNNRHELAMIHYLCSGEHGGTSFYRHKETGFEAVDKHRRKHFFEMLERQARTFGVPEPRYINGDTELFERIASYEAVFNRALVYRCTSLHSGDIGPDFTFNTDPRTGRLSVNTFLLGS